MKIIDDKGRLFNKLNVIDFLAIIFLLSLSPMFYFGYKLYHSQPDAETPKKQFIEIELDFIFKNIHPEVLNLIAAGDKEIGNDKEVVGEILTLGKAMPFNYEVVIGSDKKVITDSVLKDLPATLRIKAEVKQNNLYYKDRIVTNSSPIDFVTDKYRLAAFYNTNLIENNKKGDGASDSVKAVQLKQK